MLQSVFYIGKMKLGSQKYKKIKGEYIFDTIYLFNLLYIRKLKIIYLLEYNYNNIDTYMIFYFYFDEVIKSNKCVIRNNVIYK